MVQQEGGWRFSLVKSLRKFSKHMHACKRALGLTSESGGRYRLSNLILLNDSENVRNFSKLVEFFTFSE